MEQIFSRACGIESEDERDKYLLRECGDDRELRVEIDELLRVQLSPDSFLDHAPLADIAMTDSMEPTRSSLIGATIGNYKLLQKLGEGGMGTVFLAEQSQPIHRRVALKLVRAGMDSKQFTARFEAERQALAMMDHPNIASVYDAGCTGDDRPYFVMELVKGIPITEFCEQNNLTIRQRVELFLPLCHAVQHAHQKGIIHRDLKPNNVLVAMYDDRPVPKVIDFGVAKTTNLRLTEKTLFTMVGQIVGTWEYMSPEQAVLNQLDVDTRSDIYSLGVILYELLTGVTPIDCQRLRTAGLEEMLRLIREEEPMKPSTRVSSFGQAATATTSYERSDTNHLASGLRGDLDLIIMKTLNKDRLRRYQTPTDLADDLERHLADQPVEARAPTAIDHVRKYVRRNRGLVASLSAIFLAMAVGLFVSLTALSRAESERLEAQNQRQLASEKAAIAENSIGHIRDYMLLLALGDDSELQRALEICNRIDSSEQKVWEQMLLSQGALHRGKTDESLAHLYEGLQIAPDNLSCKALLAFTSMISCDWNASVRFSAELETREPETPEEFALMSLALCLDEEKCMLYANEAIARRDSLFARLARAIAICFHDQSKLPTALSDIRHVASKATDNAYVTAVHLFATMAKIDIATKKDSDTIDLHSKAKGLINQLAAHPEFNFGQSMCAFYFNSHGTDKECDDAWMKVLKADSKGQLWQAVPFFLTKERQADALGWVDGDDEYSEYVRQILQLKEPRDADQFRRFVEKQTKGKTIDFIMSVEFVLVFQSGDESFMKQFAKTKLHDLSRGVVSCASSIDESVLRLLASDIGDEEFLEDCNKSSFAYLTLGHLHLARGERDMAMRCYERTIDTAFYYGGTLHWARAYLRHMKADPNWPHWMNHHQQDSTSKEVTE